jgi:protein O-mannosyl-transferase
MPVRPPPWRRLAGAWGPALLVFGLTFACYWPALRGTQLWDDSAHIIRADLRPLHGLVRIWTEFHATQQYYPVLYSAFWVEHRLWGDNTLGYHLLNVLLHATSCCLLALLLRRLWGATGGPAPAAARVPEGTEWLAALLLAVHPVCVESVAWISEQKNTLSLCFALSAALAYLTFASRRRRRWYFAATVLFFLALGSKTMSATLPAALLVVLWWRNGKLSWRDDVVPLLPWFFLAIGSGLITAWVEREYVGAQGVSFALTGGQRVLLAARIVWFYLGHAVWPGGLVFFYDRWNVVQDAPSWIVWLGLSLAITAALWAIRGRARGPLAAWLLFVGPLFPALGFFNVYPFLFSFVADHFQYLAMPGFAAAVAAGVGLRLARAPGWARIAGRVVAGAAVLGLAAESRQLSGDYLTNETLFGTTVARNPQAWMAWQILGTTFAKNPARRGEAMACFRKVLALDPNYPDAHVGLAVELARLPGGGPDAIAHYERALQLRPNYIEAHNNLGVELAKLPGRLPEAIAHYEAAVKLNPEFAEAHANLAAALAPLAGRLPEAVSHFEAVARLRPDSAIAHIDLANALALLPGRSADALAHYEAALRIEPNLAWLHLGLAMQLSQMPGREAEAITHVEEALRIKPDYPDALNALAIIHAQQGQLEKARTYWEKALQIDPNFAPARQNLDLLERMAKP